MGTHIAIAMPHTPKEAVLYAEVRRRRGEAIEFCVLNGAWEGTIDGGSVSIDGKVVGSGLVVWEGPAVPQGYNAAIRIINSHLADPSIAVPSVVREEESDEDMVPY